MSEQELLYFFGRSGNMGFIACIHYILVYTM